MSNQEKRNALRAYYDAEGNRDYQSSLYQERDWIHQHLKRVVLEEVNRYCQANTSLLDAGCAEGLYLRLLHRRIKQGIGLVLSYPKLVRGSSLAKECDNLHFGAASLEQIPCASAYFDVALCVETIEHVPDH